MSTASGPIDWADWMRRWDAQQQGYLPDREERFAAMLDVLDALLPPDFVALDLACGPGSISQRILARFPRARCVAVDLDPVLLAMGRAVLGDGGGRLRWAEADLSDPNWAAALGEPRFDAALSTTALHWLAPETLVRLYRDLGALVREGGVVLNGDNMPYAPHQPTLQALADAATARHEQAAFGAHDAEDWQRWWSALAEEDAAADLLAERARRFANRPNDAMPIADLHEAAFRAAGFREVGTVWQHHDNRVLLAIR